MRNVTWAALVLFTSSPSLGGDFSEFDNPTVDFSRIYTVPALTRMCASAETISAPFGGCVVTKTPTKVMVLSPVHGVERSFYLVKTLDKKERSLFVFREDLLE